MSDLEHKITEAQHRMEDLYNETGGKCFISFSGGKDSTVMLAIAKMCAEIYTLPPEGVKAVFINTGIEMGVTVDFVNWCKSGWYPNIDIIYPEKPFDWVLKNKGKPMKSKLKAKDLHQWQCGKRSESLTRLLIYGESLKGVQSKKRRLGDRDMHMLADNFPIRISGDCCTYMKKRPAVSYAQENGMKGQAIGERASEGGARELSMLSRLANGGKLCTYSKNSLIYKLPLIDWTDENVEEFISKYNVPLSKAYTEYGFVRTGCMGCPFALELPQNLEYLYKHEPNRYKAIMHWLKDVYIAQNVSLPFDQAYEREREREWRNVYEPMRQEMLRKYRPDSRRIKDSEQLSLFDEGDEDERV